MQFSRKKRLSAVNQVFKAIWSLQPELLRVLVFNHTAMTIDFILTPTWDLTNLINFNFVNCNNFNR